MSNPNPQDMDWLLLLVALGYVATVAGGSVWAVMSGRWELAAAFVGGAVSMAAIMLWLGTRS